MKTPDAATLRRLAKREPTEVRRRFEVIVRLLEGQAVAAVSRETRMDRQRVRLWRDRFKAGGVAALREDRRRAAAPTEEQLRQLEELAIYGEAVDHGYHDCRTGKWRHVPGRNRLTSREIAAKLGLSQRTVTEALRGELGLTFRSGRWFRLTAA